MLYGSQKRFDKNGDGKLKGAEWQRWYQYAYGNEIEAKEKRRRANTAEQKRAQIAADFADHVSDLINWIYRDLAHLEGEREDQAIRTMHLALYVISAALQTQTIDESMRYLLRAFWNEFQPTFDESVYQALCAKQLLFEEYGAISERRFGSFWRNLLDNLPPERRIGKDDDLQELLDDTSRLYNYFRDDSSPEIDFAKEIEPYWAAIRLQKEPEEDDEDEEPEEESEPWTDFYEKSAPAEKPTSGGYYQFCKVQFKDGGSPYVYLTGGLPLAVGDFVVVPVENRNAEKTGRVTDVFVCSAQDAPYPPEKAKFVLRKSEQTAFTFTEKKVPPIEPAKNEKAATPMPSVPVEPPAVQSVPEEPASFKVEPLPEAPTFTLPPLPKQDEPKKPKRRIPWGWLAAGVAAVAFFVFALPPLKRTAEANRQMVIAQQAAEREKREQEEQRAEQARLEEEAAAQRRREEKQARIEALQNADLPYPGMPYEELTSTKLGKASKVTHEMRSGQVCYTFVWQIRAGDYLYPVFVVTAENEEVLTAEQRNLEYWNDMALKGTIYHQPEYKPSTSSQNQTGGTNHGSTGLRDEYDNPEDLYEDNPDWFEDEDEAWDEWEND